MEAINIGFAQVVYIALSITAVIVGIVKHGKQKKANDKFSTYIISLIIANLIVFAIFWGGGLFKSFGVPHIAIISYYVFSSAKMVSEWNIPSRDNAFGSIAGVILINLVLYYAGFYTI